MLTVFRHMTWELLRRKSWTMPVTLVGAFITPVFLLTVFRQHGPLDFHTPEFARMQFGLMMIAIGSIVAGVVDAQGPPTPWLLLPVNSATLATVRLLLGMLVAVAQFAASTALLNAAFGTDWPILGPSLVCAAAVALSSSAWWVSMNSAWVPVAVGTAWLGLTGWVNLRYADSIGAPTRLWSTTTANEIAGLLGVICFAIGLGIWGISRIRRGDTLPPVRLAWIQERFSRGLGTSDEFARNPIAAQTWFGWRQGGKTIPQVLAFLVGIWLLVWIVAGRNPVALVQSMLGIGLLLLGFGVCAAILEWAGAEGGRLEMTSFQATRPISDRDLSRVILKISISSVLLQWVIWGLGVGIGCLIAYGHGFSLWSLLEAKRVSWHVTLPGILLGHWILSLLAGSACAFGRERLIQQFATVLLTVFLGGMFIHLFFKSPGTVQPWGDFMYWTLLVLVPLLVIGTVTSFTVAARRGLLSWDMCLAAVAVAAAIIGGLIAYHTTISPIRSPWLLFFAAAIPVATAPFALTPLGVHHNRHR